MSAGQELPHLLPRDEPDHWQAQVHGQEVADPHWGERRRQGELLNLLKRNVANVV